MAIGRSFARTLTALCAVVVLGGMTPHATPVPEAPVADAAMRGEVETVRTLLRDGADVNEAQGDGMTALHWAARNDDAELADILIYAGASLDAGTRIGRYTPLHIAAREGNARVAEVLLEGGGNPAAITTNSGTTPLHLAARSGSAEIISRLIEYGAEVDAPEGAWGQTPLVFAATMNRVEAIEALLRAGANPNATSTVVDVVEMAEADGAADARLAKVLEGFKEQEGGGPGWQPTPSQVQAAIDLAREVQNRWPDVPKDDEPDDDEPKDDEPDDDEPKDDEPDDDEADEDEADEDEADAESEGSEAESEVTEGDAEEEEGTQLARPLSYAQQVGTWGGLGPLHHAVRQGHVEATLALLEGGADINQPIGDNTTPLLMASINGQWDLATILLDRGADPTIASEAGATPLYAVLEREWQPRASYAHPTEHQQQETSHLQMMERLLDAGADPNVRLTKHLWYMEYTFGVLRGSGINLKGATPFWRASYALDLGAMRLLADHGADPDIRTMKPPARRRGGAAMEEATDSVPSSADADGIASDMEGDSSTTAEGAEAETDAADAAEETDAEIVAADSEPDDEAATESEEDEEEEDKSGLPPVPTDGPAIHAIHAASGVGYGQSFAGNAHRYVPDGWLAAVTFLVEEMGADVNARDANGYTALHHAASRGDNATIRFLVDHGADVTVISRKGETVADMANGPVQRVRPFPETVALLEELGSENNHNCVSCE